MEAFSGRVLAARRIETLLMTAFDELVPRVAAEATRRPCTRSVLPTSHGRGFAGLRLMGLWATLPAPATNDGQNVCRSVCGVPGSLSVWSKIANRDVRHRDERGGHQQGAVSYAMHSPRPQWPSCQCADSQMRSCAVCSVHRENRHFLVCLTQLAEGSNLAQTVPRPQPQRRLWHASSACQRQSAQRRQQLWRW